MTSYREAGVDLDAADRHTRAIESPVTQTWKEDVVGGFGGFAAGVRVPTGYEHPILMMSTDGVGTKLEVARRAGIWSGVGHDLVAMCVDDLAAAGAKAVGFVDYLAVGSLDADRDSQIIQSIAAACSEAEIPLLGGETAEHPGVMDREAVDLAGAAMGIVEQDLVLGPEKVKSDDVIIGLRSPNLRSNGFSLVRSVMGDQVIEHAPVLLEPSVIYAQAVNRVSGDVHAAAHITGGGLAANLVRALPRDLGATIDTSTWEVPEIFDLVASFGVEDSEMAKAFNLGIGFCLIVDPVSAGDVLMETSEHDPSVIGRVHPGSGVTVV